MQPVSTQELFAMTRLQLHFFERPRKFRDYDLDKLIEVVMVMQTQYPGESPMTIVQKMDDYPEVKKAYLAFINEGRYLNPEYEDQCQKYFDIQRANARP